MFNIDNLDLLHHFGMKMVDFQNFGHIVQEIRRNKGKPQWYSFLSEASFRS